MGLYSSDIMGHHFCPKSPEVEGGAGLILSFPGTVQRAAGNGDKKGKDLHHSHRRPRNARKRAPLQTAEGTWRTKESTSAGEARKIKNLPCSQPIEASYRRIFKRKTRWRIRNPLQIRRRFATSWAIYGGNLDLNKSPLKPRGHRVRNR